LSWCGSFSDMLPPDDQIKASIRFLLERNGLEVEEIPEDVGKTPDFNIDRKKLNGCLMEVKTKQDDPEELAAVAAELESGKMVTRIKSIDRWNRLDAILSYGVKQLREYDPNHEVPHFIWFHCEGDEADLYATRLEATLYGTHKLVSEHLPGVATCYYFWNSTFFRHKKDLDGVVISQEGEAKLYLNDQSPDFSLAQASSLAQFFGTAIFYPGTTPDDPSILVNDSLEDRKSERVTIAYLCNKYGLEHLQTMPMRQYSGLMRETESSNDAESV
jgi:hypothetical protein